MISLDEQPTSAGWSADSRYLRIYSKVRGFIDLEWDPPTVIEEPIHKLVELLISRKDPNKAPAERFELRKEMPKWKAKDPRWQKLLDWWTAGRPDEVPNPNAQLLTDIPSDGAISSAPVDRDDPNSSVWVFHDSNTRPLTEAVLRRLGDDELWTARNEIFARRGAKIRGDRGASLIEKLGPEFHDSGIKPDDAYDLMNGIERANILLIKSIKANGRLGNERGNARIEGFKREHSSPASWRRARAAPDGAHLHLSIISGCAASRALKPSRTHGSGLRWLHAPANSAKIFPPSTTKMSAGKIAGAVTSRKGVAQWENNFFPFFLAA